MEGEYSLFIQMKTKRAHFHCKYDMLNEEKDINRSIKV